MLCASGMVGGQPDSLPTACVVLPSLSTIHCAAPKGALLSIWHDRLRDITAQLLAEVCPIVAIESTLQPLTGERLSFRSTNVKDEGRLDVKAQEFWNKWKQHLLRCACFQSYAPSNSKSTAAACYRKHEMEKWREKGTRCRAWLFYLPWSSQRVEAGAILPQPHSEGWPA